MRPSGADLRICSMACRTLNEAQLEALRTSLGKSAEGTKGQLAKWVFRKFITYSSQTGLYSKTEEYLKG